MIRYLRDEIDRLKGILSGRLKNPDKWQNNEVTDAEIQSAVDSLLDAEKQIEDTQTLLSQKQSTAKIIKLNAAKLADKLENFINAFHSDEPEKLLDYGLEPKKSRSKKQIPVEKLLISIKDDTDGEGFILSTTADSNADMYEWQKGVSDDASKTEVIPTMTLLKTTRKITFVDNDVKKGVRVFYRVRAVNSQGEGPWSEPVSRVQ